MTTITKERLLKIQHWRETYGADSNVMLPAEEAAELARIALASLEAEPVAWTSEGALAEVYCGETGVIGPKYIVGDVSLYRHAQPVSVDKEFIPKNLDKALGVVGVALPESKEEFNFQIERWIQRLIDRVIRYADEFKEQPAPVVPDDISGIIERFQYQADHLSEWHHIDEHSCKVNRRDLMTALEFMDSCRAAMLQVVEQPQNARQNIPENIPDGNSPAIPDDWVMVPKEPTQAMIKAWLSEVANFRGHAAGYKAALAAAPQREVK
ncbi:Eaa protein [Salmonella enterica]